MFPGCCWCLRVVVLSTTRRHTIWQRRQQRAEAPFVNHSTLSTLTSLGESVLLVLLLLFYFFAFFHMVGHYYDTYYYVWK